MHTCAHYLPRESFRQVGRQRWDPKYGCLAPGVRYSRSGPARTPTNIRPRTKCRRSGASGCDDRGVGKQIRGPQRRHDREYGAPRRNDQRISSMDWHACQAAKAAMTAPRAHGRALRSATPTDSSRRKTAKLAQSMPSLSFNLFSAIFSRVANTSSSPYLAHYSENSGAGSDLSYSQLKPIRPAINLFSYLGRAKRAR